MSKRPRYTFIDPRTKKDFHLFGVRYRQSDVEGEDFSSLAQDLAVIHAARLDWLSVIDEVEELFASTGRFRFVIYRPWWPRVQKKIAAFQTEFGPDIREEDFVQVSRASTGSGIAKRALQLRDSVGGHNSGLWIIGSYDDHERLDRSLSALPLSHDPPLFLAAAMSHEAGAVLALDEGGLSTLFVQMSVPAITAVEALVDRLGRLGYESSDQPEW